jgi:fused signal recognition particle receptor
MVHWFRRKDKDGFTPEAELPEPREPETESEGADAPDEAPAPPLPGEDIQPETTATAEELPAEAPEEEQAGEGRRRPGFWGRLFHGDQAAEPETALPVEAAPEPEPIPVEEIPAEAETPAVATIETEEIAAPLSPEEEARLAAVPEARRGLFRRFRERLGRTRKTFIDGFDLLFAKHPFVDDAFLEDLEELLITADLGVETALSLISAMQERVRRRELSNVERLKTALKAEMLEMLTSSPAPQITTRPWVVLMVGVNGVGKTTTIAKLAHRDRSIGREPLLIAADTFRAAAAEQLEIWGQRVGAPVIRQRHGADPAAVVFDGLSAALSRGVDTVYIDTAGRLHTKINLMEELKKIHRTTVKKLPGAPHEVLLVLDATTGQNAVSQARLFQEAVGLTGIVLTKLDGTAKGGVALAVVHETGIPLRFLGVGESLEDLKPFDPEAFVEAILG